MSEVEFRGYSGDCLIHGRLVVPDDVRVTDFLNSADVYPVKGASLYALEDAHAVPAGDQQLETKDLWAVEPTDTGVTPWRADLRVSTRSVMVEVELAPYRITGLLHGVKASDPLASVHRRRRMIPLTDAVIHLTYGGRPMSRATQALIFNRDRATSIRRVAYEKSLIDDLEVPPLDAGAADMTSEFGLRSDAD
jgi:hypothetical protein